MASDDHNIVNHDFDSGPFELTADQIKKILLRIYYNRK